MIDTSQIRRLEWKYRVPPERVTELTDALSRRTEPDPYCILRADAAYPVRSLYFDTPDLRFYHEKKDGLKVRRKLRVRNYGDDMYFLEIKRKINRKVLKERVSLHRSEVAGALNGMDPGLLMVDRPEADLQTLRRFRFNMTSLGLVPAVLVAYRRRALVSPLDSHMRITLDSDLQSRRPPGEDALFDAVGLRTFENNCVLELKFDRRPPHWLTELVSEFGLRREPYSKYCEGIDGGAAEPRPIAERREDESS